MPKIGNAILNWTILIHRWMGVVFCGLFLSWFVSGIVLMYCPFPGVDAYDRMSRAMTIDASRIHIAPGQALERLHASSAPSRLRLTMLDGRPIYRFAFG